jgi:hypothetical protein
MEMITINIKRNDFKQPNVLRENIVQSLCDHIVYHLNEDGNGTYSLMISATSCGAYRVFVQLNNDGSVFKLSSTLANYETKNAIKVTTKEMEMVVEILQDADYYLYINHYTSGEYKYIFSKKPYLGARKGERVKFNLFID